MLERLTETFIAGVELLEAEGRVARDQALAIGSTLLILLACGVVGLIAVVAAAVGITWLLALAIGVGAALTIVGTLLLAASVLVARGAIRGLRSRTAAKPTAATPSPPPVIPSPTARPSPDGLATPHRSHATKHAAPFVDEDLPAALRRNPPP